VVVLDLAPFIDAAKQQLIDSGFAAAARIPEVHPTVDLFAASTLVRAQTAYQTLDVVATWLPWITLLLLAAAAGNCGRPTGQYDVALVDWRRRPLHALEPTMDWLASESRQTYNQLMAADGFLAFLQNRSIASLS
jgi:hypothetical protein